MKKIRSGEMQRRIREQRKKEEETYSPELLGKTKEFADKVHDETKIWAKVSGSSGVQKDLLDIYDEIAEKERLKESVSNT